MTFIKSNVRKLILFVFVFAAVLLFAACDNKPNPDEQKLDEAINSIALVIEKKTFRIPRNTTIKHDLEITWELECEDGTVKLEKRGDTWYVVITPTPYEEDEDGEQINEWGYAKLKGTVSIGKYSRTREWEINVPPGEKVIPISEIKATYQLDDPVELNDVLVVHVVDGQGFLVQDDTGAIYVYDRNSTVAVGDLVSITGKIGSYGDAIQVVNPTVTVGLSGEEVSYDDAEVKMVAEILALDSTKQENFNRLFKVEGYVRQSKSGSNDRYHIEAKGVQIMLHYNGMTKDTETILAGKKDKYIEFCAYTYARNSQKITLMIVPSTIKEKAEPTLTDEEKVDLAIADLTAEYDNKIYFRNMGLTLENERGVEFEWSSNKPDVIDDQGIYKMPNADTEVTMTVTVTSGEVTKTVTLKIIAKGAPITTVKQTIDLIDAADSELVRTVGVVIGFDQNGYYYVADETGVIFVQAATEGIAIGDKVEVAGKGKVENRSASHLRLIYDPYHVKKVDENKHADPLTYENASVADFDFTITASNIATAVPDEELYGKGLKFDAFIVVKDGKVYLADSTDAEAQLIYVIEDSMNIGSLRSLSGAKLKMKFLVYRYDVNEGWSLVFLGRQGDIELESDLTEQQRIDIAVEDILGIVKDGADVADDLKFVTFARNPMIDGTAYVWTTDKPDIIDSTGKYTAPNDDTAVKITVEIYLNGDTSGEPDHVVEINVTALGETDKISDIKRYSINSKVEVMGIVAFVFESGFIITDRTGGLYVFGSESAATVAVGDKVLVSGTLDVINYVPGTMQIKFPEVQVLSSDHPVDFDSAVEALAIDILEWETSLDNQYKLIKTEGFIRRVISGDYTNYYLEDVLGYQIMFHFFALDDELTDQLDDLVGKYVEMTTFTFTINQGNLTLMYLPEQTEEKAAPALTTEQKLTLARKEIDAIVKEGAKISFDLPFIDETEREKISGAKYVWTVDRTDIFASDGTFTMPDEDTPVKITVKVYLSGNVAGTADATWDINITAVVIVGDLFISEYSEGSSYNKYIEIYNPTANPIDLSGYSLALYSNGATEPKIKQLVGTLNPGETFVVAHTDADQTILNATDMTDSAMNVINFNGNDAVALLKGDTPIDVIGVIGEDPGDKTGWKIDGTVATMDHTLIRKPTVSSPSAEWNTSEWIIKGKNDWSDIGQHTKN